MAELPMCQDCWTLRYYPDDAVVVQAPIKESCAYCLEPAEAGIYVVDRAEWIAHEAQAVPLFEFNRELPDGAGSYMLIGALPAAISTKCIPVRVEAEGFKVALVYCGIEPHHVDNGGRLRPHRALEHRMDFIVHLISDEPRREAHVRVFGINCGTTVEELAKYNRQQLAKYNEPKPVAGSTFMGTEPLRVELQPPT